MTRLVTAGLVTAFAFCSFGVAAGQSADAPAGGDTTTLVWARKLLDAKHAQRGLLAGFDSAFAAQRKEGGPPGRQLYLDSLAARARRQVPQLVDSVAVAWAGQLSAADLQDLVRFYASPLGQRYAGAELGVELQVSGLAQRWGMRLAIDVMKDLIDKGLISPSDLSP